MDRRKAPTHCEKFKSDQTRQLTFVESQDPIRRPVSDFQGCNIRRIIFVDGILFNQTAFFHSFCWDPVLRIERMFPDVTGVNCVKNVLTTEQSPDSTRRLFNFLRSIREKLLAQFLETKRPGGFVRWVRTGIWGTLTLLPCSLRPPSSLLGN